MTQLPTTTPHIKKYLLITMGVIIAAVLGYQLWEEFIPLIEMMLSPHVSHEALLAHVRSHDIRIGILLVLLTAVLCAIPGPPTSILGILIGVCYGPYWGSLMNIGGNTIGNVLSFLILRKFNIIDSSHKKNRWVQMIAKAKHRKAGIAIAYMIPVVPSFLVNFTASLLSIPLRKLLPLMLIGVSPSSILYAFGGDAIFKGHFGTAMILIACVAISLLFVKLIQQDKKRHTKH